MISKAKFPVLLSSVLALGLLAGCGAANKEAPAGLDVSNSAPSPAGPDKDDSDDAKDSETPAPSASEAEPTPTDIASEPNGSAGNTVGLLAAADLARAQVPGAVIVAVDLDFSDQDWEFEMYDAQGFEYDISISADGSKITEPLDKDDTDADDRKEHVAALKRVKVDLDQAVAIITDKYPSAVIDDLDLDEDDSSVHWDVELEDSRGDYQDFEINAVTGAIQ